MSLITGSQDVQEQPSILSFTPGVGHRTTRVFKGPTAAIIGQYYAAAAAGYSCMLRRGYGGMDTLEASIGLDASNGGSVETPQEIWTMRSVDVEKDLLEADLSIISGLSADDKATIRKSIDSPDGTDPGLTGDADTIYKLMLNGVRSVRVMQPVLGVTYLATANYAGTRSASNVGLRFTNAQLTSLEGAPSALLVGVPSSGSATRSDISVVYAWLKKFPSVEQVGSDLFRVSVEFEYGLWSTVMYGAAS